MAIAEWKTKEFEEITNLISTHPVVGIVRIGNVPAPQLQKMRQNLRGKASLKVAKNSLISRALTQMNEKAKGIEKISEAIEGETALIVTESNPFKLFKEIERTRTKAPARGGETAQNDINVEKGETPFKPGPIVGELQNAGIPAAIAGGAVVIKEAKTLVKKGDKIPPHVAKMLTRLEIYPLEIGLDVRAVYENEIVFTPDILKVDSDALLRDFRQAAWSSYNLALKIGYATKATITPLIKKAYLDSVFLATHCNILIPETTKNLLTKAYAQAFALQTHTKSLIKEKLGSPQADNIEEKKEQQQQKQAPEDKKQKQAPEDKKQKKKKAEAHGEDTGKGK